MTLPPPPRRSRRLPRLAPSALAALLAMAGALGASAAHGAERTPFQIRCEDTISKTISVLSSQQNGYSVDQHLSYRALTAMNGVVSGNVKVLGLTRTESRMSIALGGPILQDPVSGYECVAPQITVKLYYAPVKVYVGSEFATGTCGYQEILAHEMRHLKTYMDHLPKVEKLVREALAKRFEARPLYAPSGTAMSALEQEINTGWIPYIKAEMAKVEELQAQIDAPEEYARLSRSCGGELQVILGGARRGK